MTKLKVAKDSLWGRLQNIKLLIFFSNFIFQGMRYMTPFERTYKIIISLIFFLSYFSLGVNIYAALFLGHFTNFLLNGQFFVLARYLFDKDVLTEDSLVKFISLINKSYSYFGVKDVFIIGSFCRCCMHNRSDLDLRVLHGPTFKDSLMGCTYGVFLRFIGLIYQFPMDVYCFSHMKFLEKIRDDESPSYLVGNENFLKKYPNSLSIDECLKLNLEKWK